MAEVCGKCASIWHVTKEHDVFAPPDKTYIDPNFPLEETPSEVQVGTLGGFPVMALSADEADLILHATEKKWAKPLLLQADELIHGERAKTYGPVGESFQKIAIIFNNMLTAAEWEQMAHRNCLPTAVAKMLIAVKLVRESNSPEHRDSLIDAAGYIGLLDELKP